MLASRPRPFTSSGLRRAARPPVTTLRLRAQAGVTLRSLLDDAANAGLGKVRFIVLGDGAILESVNNFGSVRYNEVPNRGVLATVASEDKSFECHIILSKVKEVKFVKSKAKSGEYDIYAMRFLGDDSKVLMSCLLHGQQGQYDPAAVAAWTDLATKYGESFTF